MSGPKTYYHLPTLARAIQFTEENVPEIKAWLTTLLGEQGGRWDITPEQIVLDTDEGDRDSGPGHWIVQDPDGGLHLINPNLMPRLYNLEGGL